MASIWTGLAFMHGHIGDPALARRLAATLDARPASNGKPPAGQTACQASKPPRVLVPIAMLAAAAGSFRHSLRCGFGAGREPALERPTPPPRRAGEALVGRMIRVLGLKYPTSRA